MTKYIIGYDPGGNRSHGACVFNLDREEKIECVEYPIANTVKEVLDVIDNYKEGLIAIGVDTFTTWGLGKSGWRPADCFLRNEYTDVQNSVFSLNSSSASMSINGAIVVKHALNIRGLVINEVHPKLYYHAIKKRSYGLEDHFNNGIDAGSHQESNGVAQRKFNHLIELENQIELYKVPDYPVPQNDHQFDAFIAAFCAWKREFRSSSMPLDLHLLAWETKYKSVLKPGNDGYEAAFAKTQEEIYYPFGNVDRIFYPFLEF